MKYCTHCGKEINDEAFICLGCGCKVENENKKPDLDVKEKELCPQIYFWTYMTIYTLCILFGFLAISYNFIFDDFAILTNIFAIISLILFTPSMAMSIIGLIKKWTHYQLGSKAYPIRFVMGIVFSVVGLICSIFTLIF